MGQAGDGDVLEQHGGTPGWAEADKVPSSAALPRTAARLLNRTVRRSGTVRRLGRAAWLALESRGAGPAGGSAPAQRQAAKRCSPSSGGGQRLHRYRRSRPGASLRARVSSSSRTRSVVALVGTEAVLHRNRRPRRASRSRQGPRRRRAPAPRWRRGPSSRRCSRERRRQQDGGIRTRRIGVDLRDRRHRRILVRAAASERQHGRRFWPFARVEGSGNGRLLAGFAPRPACRPRRSPALRRGSARAPPPRSWTGRRPSPRSARRDGSPWPRPATCAGVIASIRPCAAPRSRPGGRSARCCRSVPSTARGGFVRTGQAADVVGLDLARSRPSVAGSCRWRTSAISRWISLIDSAVLSVCTGAEAIHGRWPRALLGAAVGAVGPVLVLAQVHVEARGELATEHAVGDVEVDRAGVLVDGTSWPTKMLDCIAPGWSTRNTRGCVGQRDLGDRSAAPALAGALFQSPKCFSSSGTISPAWCRRPRPAVASSGRSQSRWKATRSSRVREAIEPRCRSGERDRVRMARAVQQRRQHAHATVCGRAFSCSMPAIHWRARARSRPDRSAGGAACRRTGPATDPACRLSADR